ncbi:DUF1361 domain-containing protein [Clostridium sp. YIM B02515]|uniref:DUF1361 domain-containing protein n=1 Tax=Clostridium rhizosphaerae TaxID=2803861 RepID=A0ABS1TD55_9CLOT|nr:DUF1361 domain-containing protein [Clostridium rhizosphaerae]MBL4937265.1 DUF1361 domain-containing protein [Clostridium rhizosphaerae]
MRKVRNYLRVLALIYCIWVVFSSSGQLLYMAWNLFLALVPFEAANLLYKIKKEHLVFKGIRIITIGLCILWLLFYPNAPYIITDFIHINSNKFFIPNPKYVPYGLEPKTLFNDNFKLWLNYINIGIGVWLGYMFGIISLYINQKLIEDKFGRARSWVFVVAINLLSGFAIYLGRFIRWNSWDVIFDPLNIIYILINDIHIKALNFTLLFGVFNLILYIITVVTLKLMREK